MPSRSTSRCRLSRTFPHSLSLSLFRFEPRPWQLQASLLPPTSAEDPRHAVDDRRPLPVQPPPPLLLPRSSSFAAAFVAVVVRNPHKERPLAHRPDGVAAVLPRALLARDLEPGREGDEAFVVVPGIVFFFRFRFLFLFFQ